jgi:hypothetical protein
MKNKDLNAAIGLIRRWQAEEVLDQGSERIARSYNPGLTDAFS